MKVTDSRGSPVRRSGRAAAIAAAEAPLTRIPLPKRKPTVDKPTPRGVSFVSNENQKNGPPTRNNRKRKKLEPKVSIERKRKKLEPKHNNAPTLPDSKETPPPLTSATSNKTVRRSPRRNIPAKMSARLQRELRSNDANNNPKHKNVDSDIWQAFSFTSGGLEVEGKKHKQFPSLLLVSLDFLDQMVLKPEKNEVMKEFYDKFVQNPISLQIHRISGESETKWLRWKSVCDSKKIQRITSHFSLEPRMIMTNCSLCWTLFSKSME